LQVASSGLPTIASRSSEAGRVKYYGVRVLRFFEDFKSADPAVISNSAIKTGMDDITSFLSQ
jgi:hypothetical protein